MRHPVKGRCPACGDTRLVLVHGGDVRCTNRACPNPYAATEVLALPHTHRLCITDGAWIIEHPNACRVGGNTPLTCEVTQHFGVDGPLDLTQPGVWDIHLMPDGGGGMLAIPVGETDE